MDEPWTLRDPNAPSEWAIDAVVAGEASAAQIAQLERHLAAHPEFQAVLDARRAGFESLPMANPQAMRARILQASEAQTVAAPAPAPRRRWAAWTMGLGALAAAAAAIVLGVRSPEPATIDDTVITKGDAVGVAVFRERAGVVDALISGAEVTAGDRLRFKAELADAQRGGHVLVVGVPTTGAPFGYAPAGATRSIPAARLEADGSFPGSARLDASVGAEWAHLVWCPAAFAMQSVGVDGPGRVTVEPGCVATAFALIKR